jgi:peptidoglycan/xylan/chitin deacetylase (PgdA/CDA1 family)
MPAGHKTAYLTFDDGPSPVTGEILAVLRKERVKATFFVIGSHDEAERKLYRRLVAEGHTIGNHSFSHNYAKIYQSMSAFKRDFFQLERLLAETAGIKTRFMRFPGGSNNTVSRRYAWPGLMQALVSEMDRLGYIHFDWNVEAGDATTAINDSGAIRDNILAGAAGKSNALILLHDGRGNPATAEALPDIIGGLRRAGFNFAVLSPVSYRVQFLKP